MGRHQGKGSCRTSLELANNSTVSHFTTADKYSVHRENYSSQCRRSHSLMDDKIL